MAIWQYRFTVLPKGSFDEVDLQYDEEGLLEDDLCWLKAPTKTKIFKDFENVIPKRDSWAKELLLFGSEETNCLEVYSENDFVTSVSFRVDFSGDYEYFLRMTIKFLNLNGMIILDEGGELLEPNYELMKKKILESPQFKKYEKLRC